MPMAPHNSTLIQSPLVESSPELQKTDYSPILAPRFAYSDRSHRTSTVGSESLVSAFTDHEANEWPMHPDSGDEDEGSPEDDEEIPIWIGKEDVRYVSGVTPTTTCSDVIAVLIQDELMTKNYPNVEGLRREVDDYIIVEKWRDVESKLRGETKILPLFQAWGNLQDEVKFRLKINKYRNLEQIEAKIEKKVAKKDKMNLMTRMIKRVLRQGDYIQKHISVLKEKRDRTPSHNLKASLHKKILYETCRPSNSTQSLSSSKCSSVERLYCKCCRNLTIKNKGFEISKLAYSPKPQPETDSEVRTDDELLLILDAPESQLHDSIETLKADSGHASGHSFSFQEVEEGDLGSSLNVDATPATPVAKKPVASPPRTVKKKPLIRSESYLRSMKGSESSLSSSPDPIRVTPKRRARTMRAYEVLRQHSLNKKLLESLSHLNSSNPTPVAEPRSKTDQFDSIRLEIMEKMHEMKQLLVREELLLTQIQMKCAHYKAENEAYNSRVELDLQVDEIQKNLEDCAAEIIQNERELFRTKLEVERKAQILQSLKSLLNIGESDEELLQDMRRFKERSRKQLEKVRCRMSLDELNFVDNIYEFCDGNKSVVV